MAAHATRWWLRILLGPMNGALLVVLFYQCTARSHATAGVEIAIGQVSCITRHVTRDTWQTAVRAAEYLAFSRLFSSTLKNKHDWLSLKRHYSTCCIWAQRSIRTGHGDLTLSSAIVRRMTGATGMIIIKLSSLTRT